ncbi:biotin--protein ligase isoform X2 [Aricia agestis]|uniref:biotin--protein ligase isoform X2 n=1 Tax=Aricia agestis TaxID=91739 RepID=UPI001C204C46|nr:biotin--protein ligase isoform X2 [Aricia agestis]
MLVTTFYLAMTFINAWRMRSLKSHLLKFMSWKSSAVLYKFSSEIACDTYEMGYRDIYKHNDNVAEVTLLSLATNSISPLKAKLIIERKVHYITDVIEITETTRMCRLRPIQFIDINRWFSIANGLPLWSSNVFQQPDPTPKLCVFIECEMEPSEDQSQDDVIPLESLGQVWAWRADKNLEFIAVIPFNKLLEMCYKFLYGSLIINERLPVTRIQTVYATGMPYQPEDDQINTLKKIIKEAHKTSEDLDWTYYSGILKHMYREVFVNSNKMAKSYITSVPSQILSPPQTHPDSSEKNIESNNSNHCEENNHHERTQELIRALSQEIESEPTDESNKKSPEEQIKALSDEMEPKTSRETSKKSPSEIEANHKNAKLQETVTEPKLESYEISSQTPIETFLQELKSEPPQVLNVESIQEQVQASPQKIEANHKVDKKSIQEQSQPSSQESNVKSPEGKRTLQKQKQVQESSRRTKQVEESTSKPVKGSKQEMKPEPKQEIVPKSDEIQESRQTHQKQDSLKPSQESGSSSRSSTPEILEGTIVRSETVNIRQKLSPSRKRKTNKGAATIETTIESVTTHRRVTSLIPPSQERTSSSMSEKSDKKKIDLPKSTGLDVLVYSESVVAKNNLIATLKNVLDPERYTIYSVPLTVLCSGAWRGKVALIAVVGNTGEATPHLLRYFLDGGRLLAICSDLLQSVVPYYRTAEIRENEIVQFSFDKWKAVKLKHHVLCFQASPAKKQFSSESDRHVLEHELFVEVLANEETWRTPSLIQVAENTNHGVSIFSQIHLETDPAEYLGEEGPKYNKSRYEILFKILGDIISLHVKDMSEIPTVDYTEGYFFGDEKIISKFLSELPEAHKKRMSINGALIEWLTPGQSPTHPPSHNHLPVRISQIPKTFDYETYLKNLTSTTVGRVLLYSPVVGTTTTWCAPLAGLAVVAGQQLAGRGRAHNQFISPPGQAVLSVQVWQEMNDRIALTQNVAALAAVLAIRSETPYEGLDIRIKWPNDIYYGRSAKIGGVMTTADVMEDKTRIYIGIGVNISNSVPTTCVNDIISKYNALHNTHLPPLSVEWFLARFNSHLERILADMATDNGHKFFEDYYKYWLHSAEQISVIDKDGKRVSGTIHGMDKFGFLLVDTPAGQLTVNPDGNSFDLMANLVVAKY